MKPIGSSSARQLQCQWTDPRSADCWGLRSCHAGKLARSAGDWKPAARLPPKIHAATAADAVARAFLHR
jgi:hypothetical protein